MINVFSDHYPEDATDGELVKAAQQGDRTALEALVARHQSWIFNIAWRMVGSPENAEDVTQEILIKILTKLSTFEGRSSFRTWLYRIVANHVINMRRRPREYVFSSFAAHDNVRSNIPDLDIPDSQSIPVDVALLIEETRINCMIGMLLCLDRQQRLVFILGAVMGASSEVAGDILEITPANFRQQLSRARQQLSNFMNERCGLINPENPCRCARKTKALVMGGYVNPHDLQFHSQHVEKAKAIVTRYAPSIDDVVELRSQTLFQEHPMLKSPDYVKSIQHILRRDEFQRMLNFN